MKESSSQVFKKLILFSGNYAACGFQIQLVRKTMQYLVQVRSLNLYAKSKMGYGYSNLLRMSTFFAQIKEI